MDDVVWMVRGRTQAICQRELDWLCQQRGATPAMNPTDVMPPGWVARAIVRDAGTAAATEEPAAG